MSRRVALLRGPDGIVDAVNVPSFTSPETIAKLSAAADGEGLEIEFLVLSDIHDWLADLAEKSAQGEGAE